MLVLSEKTAVLLVCVLPVSFLYCAILALILF